MQGAGVQPEELASLADLRKLPLMNKHDAATNRDALVWRGVPGGAFKYNTGGSSGQPLIFHFGRRRQASDAAGRMRARGWWGVRPGEPEVYLWGAPVELNKTDWVKTVRDRLINQLVLNAFAMSPARMDGYLDAIEAFKPHCLYGYASSVALLAAHAKERNRKPRLPALKVVCTTGEPLYDHQRALISDVFGVPVANEFGSRDIGFTAHETPQGQLLLMSESIVLEVLDEVGNPVAEGELGEAVMTGLCSDAQPFIRYRTGDMVRLSPEADRAGRGLHVIAEVVGRSTDFLVRADGTIMHALAGIYVVRGTEGVAEFKLVQHELRDLEVLVVPDARWTPAGALAIEAGLRQRLGADVRVTVRVVEAIAPEASGKHRYVVSHVPLAGELKRATSRN
jgi:phenylacetate-CoA ligase